MQARTHPARGARTALHKVVVDRFRSSGKSGYMLPQPWLLPIRGDDDRERGGALSRMVGLGVLCLPSLAVSEAFPACSTCNTSECDRNAWQRESLLSLDNKCPSGRICSPGCSTAIEASVALGGCLAAMASSRLRRPASGAGDRESPVFLVKYVTTALVGEKRSNLGNKLQQIDKRLGRIWECSSPMTRNSRKHLLLRHRSNPLFRSLYFWTHQPTERHQQCPVHVPAESFVSGEGQGMSPS